HDPGEQSIIRVHCHLFMRGKNALSNHDLPETVWTAMPGNARRRRSMMISKAGLKVADELAAFVEQRALPGTGIEPAAFWDGLSGILARFAPENAALLVTRDRLQAKIDSWHEARAGQQIDPAEYQAF